ncbi:hypothetical protein EG329_006060 [Mollisiaceae sp. DMI_Dod_QoI]|nr:hypothetical protein EG329_006060 [Helotiales sp. DMI_Dod_QoI]
MAFIPALFDVQLKYMQQIYCCISDISPVLKLSIYSTPASLSSYDPDACLFQDGLQKHIGGHLQSLALVSLPWDTSRSTSLVSSNQAQRGQKDINDPQDGERLETETGEIPGSSSNGDDMPNFDDPPNLETDTEDNDVCQYRKLPCRTPDEQLEEHLHIREGYEIALTDIEDTDWTTINLTLCGGEWTFLEAVKSPYWKGILPYQGHADDPRMTEFARKQKETTLFMLPLFARVTIPSKLSVLRATEVL